jgi:NAD(P)H-hydrate epimerase
MENAALQTVKHLRRFIPDGGRAVVVCGPGNNGGDGYAIARQLYAGGAAVAVIIVDEPATEDARLNYEIVKAMGITPLRYTGGDGQSGSAASELNSRKNEKEPSFINKPGCIRLITEADAVVDALFGIGLTRPLTGAYAELVELINNCAKHIVSVDVPSGLDADTGQPAGKPQSTIINAELTVTYGHVKTGLLFYPGAAHAGEVIVEGISLPPSADKPFTRILDDGDISKLMPPRLRDSNKGSHGRVCVLAGSAAMPGAAVLACTAAYRAGAGLVDTCAVTDVTDVIHMRLPEAVTTPLTKTIAEASTTMQWRAAVGGSLAKADVILLGPGLGQEESVLAMVRAVLEDARQPIVLDADGLNAVAVIGTDLLRELRAPCVVTPHPGEMSRLTGLPVEEIKKYPLRIAQEFSDKYGVVVLLKGARTVVASPDAAAYVNTSGCAALAKAGAGDVLAGVIAGIAAQKVAASANGLTVNELAETAALAAFIHGKAGEHAAKELSVYGVNAADVIEALGYTLRCVCLRHG